MVANVAVTVPGSTLAWAANVIGSAATVVRVEQLRMRSGPWLLRIEHDGATSDAVLKSGPAVDWRESYACEKAALELAAANDLPVPRILGSRLDATGDEPVALLMTWIPGTVRIPQVASVDRLRALGQLAAMLHAIALAPSERLPMRVRHTGWVDFSSLRRAARRYRAAAATRRDAVIEGLLNSDFIGWPPDELRATLKGTESSLLFDAADERLHGLGRPDGPTVFVHGDLWQGNTLWSGNECVGVIDWETAGAGQPGVDLGCLRWDAAILFGATAPDDILAGWEAASGRPARDVAYWDLAAALNTPADMRRILPALHEAGRTDLEADTLTARQEGFLRTALERLDDERP